MIGDTKITPGDWQTIESRIGTITPATGGSGSVAMPDPGEIEADAVLQAFRMLGRVQGHGRGTTMGWGSTWSVPGWRTTPTGSHRARSTSRCGKGSSAITGIARTARWGMCV